jgi:flagellar protein FliO/FliZ
MSGPLIKSRSGLFIKSRSGLFIKSRSGLLLVMSLPGAAFAAEETRRFGSAVPELSVSMMIQFGLGLALIISLIYLLAWVSRKIQRSTKTEVESLKIVAGLSVGTRERLLLVQVYDEQVLVGITPGQVSMLHVLHKIPTLNAPINTPSDRVQKKSDDTVPLLSDFLTRLNRQIS